MAAREEVRAVIIGEDRASDAFSKVGRSVGDMSGKMDVASKASDYLDDALKRQQKTAMVSADATLALAKSDEILAEVEKRLTDGALEAEFALKKQAEGASDLRDKTLESAKALGITKDANGKFRDKAGEVITAAELEARALKKVRDNALEAAWGLRELDKYQRGGLFSRLGGLFRGGGSGSGSGGGFLSSLPAFSGLVNPYTIGAGAAITPFAAQALGGGLIFGLGAGLAGLGIAGALGSGKTVTAAQLQVAQLRLQAAQAAAAKKNTPSAQAALISAQANLAQLQDSAQSPAQLAIRKSFHSLSSDAQDSLSQIGKAFQPVMLSIFNTADSTLKKLTPVFAGAEKIIAGPFKVFSDTLLKSFSSPQVKTSIDAVAGAFGKILTALAPGIPGDVNEIATGITKIANAVAANPQAFATFVNDLFKIGQVALSVIADLIKTASYIEAHFRPALHRVAVVFDGVRHEIAHIWDMTWNNTIGRLIRGLNDIDRLVSGWVHEIAVIFDGARHEVAHIWDMVWNNTVGRAQRGIADVVKFVSSLPGKIEGVFKDAGTWLIGAGKALVSGIVSGIQAAGGLVMSAIEGLIPGPLRGVVNKVIGWGAHALGFASGTASAPPGWAWVGERGPELMRFSGGEQVMSAPASSAYAAARNGGSTYVINVTVSPLAHPADTGREVVNAIRAFEKSSGKSWRS